MNFDLNTCPLSERNGTYGGKAGSKEGILIDGEYWIVKYPQNTQGMRGTLASYTTAPLSEYIGSHIYAILRIDVHRTELGTRNGKLVVICKDFCKPQLSKISMQSFPIKLYLKGNTTMIDALYNYRRYDESCLQSWLEEGVTMIQAIQN